MAGISTTAALHESIEQLLSENKQRYSDVRRRIIETLHRAERPLTVPELTDELQPPVAYSSLYRNLVQLVQVGVLRRIQGNDDTGRFELSEELHGDHHHHLVCLSCGDVVDIASSTKLERAVAAEAEAAFDEEGFIVTEHRIDFAGYCKRCGAPTLAD